MRGLDEKATTMRIVRTLLTAVCLLATLMGLTPRAEAGTGPYHTTWAKFPPALDGNAATGGWASVPPAYQETNVSIYFQNDQTYLYSLIDVPADTGNNVPGSEDFFWLAFDVDQDTDIGPDDVLFAPVSGKLLGKANFPITDPLQFVPEDSTYSHVAAGFGPTPTSSTPHRYWEVAIRLEEISAQPEDTLKFGLRVKSAQPAIDEWHPDKFTAFFDYLNPIHMWSPEIAYIYNGVSGIDPYAEHFRTILLSFGYRVTLVDLNNGLAGVDLKPYDALTAGWQSGSAAGWGTAADRQILQATGKPVIAIGLAAQLLYGSAGLDLPMGPAISSFSGLETIMAAPSLHPAWYSPRRVGVSGGTLTVVVPGSPHADFAMVAGSSQGLVRFGPAGTTNYYPLAAESFAGQCFTLWGWLDDPSTWTPEGGQLFANLLAHPPCQPSMLYVYKDAATPGGLAAAVNLFNQAGIYSYTAYCATVAASGIPAGVEQVVIDYAASDGPVICAGSLGAVEKIRQSSLPVVGMGAGGNAFFGKIGLQIGYSTGSVDTIDSLGALYFPVDPSGWALQRPFNPLIRSSRLLAVYSVDADTTEVILDAPGPMIKTWGRTAGVSPQNQYVYVAERVGSRCFVLWGANESPDAMTMAGKQLFLNAIIDPPCGEYQVFVPAIFH